MADRPKNLKRIRQYIPGFGSPVLEVRQHVSALDVTIATRLFLYDREYRAQHGLDAIADPSADIVAAATRLAEAA